MARCISRVATVSHWTSIASRNNILSPSQSDSNALVPTATAEKIASGDMSCDDTPEEMRKFLYEVITRVDGLHAIFITDRDGVPVLRVAADQTPDSVIKPNFLATVSMATDQAGKLGIGKSRRIICIFTTYQVVHFNKYPLMISLIADSKANTGLLLTLESELESLIEDLRTAVDGM